MSTVHDAAHDLHPAPAVCTTGSPLQAATVPQRSYHQGDPAMKKFTKILLPVDGSKTSRTAKEHAIALATAMEAEIVLVYITGLIPAIITGKPREEAVNAQKEEADTVLKPYRNYLNDHRITYNEVISSAFHPGDEICKIANNEGCDLIVMGSRGLSDIEGLFLGSVTHRVLARCDIPVMVVR